MSVRTVQRNDAGEFSPVTVTMSELGEPPERPAASACVVAGDFGKGIGGLLAGLGARRVAKVAPRPLRSTAEAIGAIDEENLGGGSTRMRSNFCPSPIV